MAITSSSVSDDDEHANGIGWITSLNVTDVGRLSKAISLLSAEKCNRIKILQSSEQMKINSTHFQRKNNCEYFG